MSCYPRRSRLVIGCRIVTSQVASCTAVLLVLVGFIPASAQEPTNIDSRQTAASQPSSAPEPSPQTQSQAPSAGAGQNPAPLPANKKHKLNCRHAANPTKRRFGCKDEGFDWEETLTQDWTGARTEAKKLGITPSGSYYSALQTNATGSSTQMWGYVGQLTTAIDFDFQKLLKIRGMSLYFSDSWGTGSNLTSAIGSVFPVNPNYAVGAYLGEIYLQQKAVSGKLTLAAGRLAANYTFAGLPVFDNYVSFAIDPTPVAMVSNDLSYAGPPPGLQWGAQAVYSITGAFEVAAGVFNTNANSANNGNVFAFQQGNKGALVTAQASYLYNQAASDKGMPGQYTAGFFEDNNSFATIPNAAIRSGGNAGVFLLGQQMLYRPEGADTLQGLTVWGAWAYTSKQLVNPMPVFGGGGLSYEGLVKARKQDIISAGWIYGKSSQFIPNGSAAKLLEVNYQWVPTRYITIIPDFQYIWEPTGTNKAGSGTAVVGLQLNVTF